MVEKKSFFGTKKFYIPAAIIGILIISGIAYWNYYKYKLVDKKVDELVTGKTKGLYQISYQNLSIDEALGNLSVNNLDMTPDTAVYHAMMAENKAPSSLFLIKIPTLSITGVKTPKALLQKEISAGIIRIQNPSVRIWLSKTNKPQKSGFFRNIGPELFRQLLGNLKSINADSVVVENASLELMNKKSGKTQVLLSGLSFRFAGIAIDSLGQLDSNRILFSKEVLIHCNNLEVPAGEKMYALKIADIDFNSATGRLHAGKFQMTPRLSETEFANNFRYAKDRIDIKMGSIDLFKLDRMAYLNDQLVAQEVEINHASFHVFRDKSRPHDSVDRTNDYPQQALMRLPFSIDLKKVTVKNSYIEYKEKNEKSDSSGKVAFFNVQATFENVTNSNTAIQRNPWMTLHYTADFLNQSKFSADIRMRLNDKLGYFTLHASLASMNATSLNPLLKPMALAELKKGKINSLEYHFAADKTGGKGKLIFKYDDISIKLLKKDEDKNKYKQKFLPTLAAGILLKNSNPSNGKMRIGDVDYHRDIHRSIFNLMWKSMFSGIKQVAL